MKNLFGKVGGIFTPILYLLDHLLLIPLILDLRKNIMAFKKAERFLIDKINMNTAFAQFLENHNFREAMFSRLYSVQTIPEELAEELNDIALDQHVLESIAKKHNFMISNGFLEILLMRTKRINRLNYVIILEISNLSMIFRICLHIFFSLILWAIIARCVYIFQPDIIHTTIEYISNFIKLFFNIN